MGALLTQDGFVAILKKVSTPTVLAVKSRGMAGQQPAYHGGDFYLCQLGAQGENSWASLPKPNRRRRFLADGC